MILSMLLQVLQQLLLLLRGKACFWCACIVVGGVCVLGAVDGGRGGGARRCTEYLALWSLLLVLRDFDAIAVSLVFCPGT